MKKIIDETGRIVLPKEVGKALGMNEKTLVEIWVNTADNEIVIRKHISICMHCGADENLKKYRNKYICGDCRQEIIALI